MKLWEGSKSGWSLSGDGKKMLGNGIEKGVLRILVKRSEEKSEEDKIEIGKKIVGSNIEDKKEKERDERM